MTACKHESIEYIGEQKTDDGVNIYRKCKSCGTLFVLTPVGKVIAVKGVKPEQAPSGKS